MIQVYILDTYTNSIVYVQDAEKSSPALSGKKVRSYFLYIVIAQLKLGILFVNACYAVNHVLFNMFTCPHRIHAFKGPPWVLQDMHVVIAHFKSVPRSYMYYSLQFAVLTRFMLLKVLHTSLQLQHVVSGGKECRGLERENQGEGQIRQ